MTSYHVHECDRCHKAEKSICGLLPRNWAVVNIEWDKTSDGQTSATFNLCLDCHGLVSRFLAMKEMELIDTRYYARTHKESNAKVPA